jgi:broad specificity phosphatase PhoE
VRHGETEWNRVRRYQGWQDSPLTQRGLAQAAAIGRQLARMPEAAGAELIASPIGRARHTAEIIRDVLGRAAPLRFDDRLREISIGEWEGRDRGELAECMPGMFDGSGSFEWYFNAPGGETYDGCAGRVGAWLAEVAGQDVIAVTHGVVTRVMRGLYGGLPRAAALQLPVPQDRCYRLAGGVIEEIALAAD